MNLAQEKPRDDRLQTGEQRRIEVNTIIRETKELLDGYPEMPRQNKLNALIMTFIAALEACNGYEVFYIFTRKEQIKEWTWVYVNEQFKNTFGYEFHFKDLPDWRRDFITEDVIRNYMLYFYYRFPERKFFRNPFTGKISGSDRVVVDDDISKFVYIYSPLNVEITISNST